MVARLYIQPEQEGPKYRNQVQRMQRGATRRAKKPDPAVTQSLAIPHIQDPRAERGQASCQGLLDMTASRQLPKGKEPTVLPARNCRP